MRTRRRTLKKLCVSRATDLLWGQPELSFGTSSEFLQDCDCFYTLPPKEHTKNYTRFSIIWIINCICIWKMQGFITDIIRCSLFQELFWHVQDYLENLELQFQMTLLNGTCNLSRTVCSCCSALHFISHLSQCWVPALAFVAGHRAYNHAEWSTAEWSTAGLWPV